ncbi:Hsp20 family protein [uncultured Sphingomonas sp.]|uniref:Hsp20 family protein n=1 Tax=uncultured Sphingomonas sp. TaxID=158754 RepID=UPI0037493376
MRQIDFTPYRRSTIGFDRLFDMLEQGTRSAPTENYPPFNLERVAEDRYRITLAVAGFRSDELDITAQQNLLVVAGKKTESQDNAAQMLHLGIANRSFERRFELADFIRVADADLKDGLLVINLVREIPEAMKPKKVSIGSITSHVEVSAVEAKAA